MRKLVTAVAVALVVIAVANFLAAFFGAVMLGGDALNGRIENGHYFVGNHGKLTEVSRNEWWFSAFHSASIFVTHPLGMAAMALLVVSLLLSRRNGGGRSSHCSS